MNSILAIVEFDLNSAMTELFKLFSIVAVKTLFRKCHEHSAIAKFVISNYLTLIRDLY